MIGQAHDLFALRAKWRVGRFGVYPARKYISSGMVCTRGDKQGKMPTVQSGICFETGLFLTVAQLYSLCNKCVEIMMVSVTPLSKFVQYMICLFPSTLPSPKLQQKPIQLL